MTWNSTPNMAKATPFDGSQMEQIGRAVQTLENVIAEDDGDTVFLWTGGKEANVIADMLLYAVGEPGVSPIPFGIIDTGNQFDEMYAFREDFLDATGDQGADTVGPFGGVDEVITVKYEEMLEKIIENENDPRGYHGEHTGEWNCADCGAIASLNRKNVQCNKCGTEEPLVGVRSSNVTPEEWDVAASCGALKVVPLKRFIENHGFTTLITGRRADDPIVQSGERSGVELREEHDNPAPHTRVNPLASWKEGNVWAYMKAESVSYPELYNRGYRHTDAACCTEDPEEQVGEYGEGGVDAEKEAVRDRLQGMGYI